jgi:hypothetical protein
MLRKHSIIAIGIVTGVALEIGIHALSGRREAWDSAEYWTLGLPSAMIVSVILGVFSRDRDWIWTCVIVPSQAMTMILRSGELGGLWPLTVILSTILSTPFVVGAFIGSRFRPAR